ncbi:MAG: metal-dependent transcriptional regulator [Lachnospiraceae bacterium]|nr:metal-dependent transcriptional regulator [Lachnospiraceae bacterium]
MALKESGEMYIETIHVLSQKSNNVRSIDISEHMGYSKPSVSRAIRVLKKEGLITTDDNGFIKLTKEGQSIATNIYERHTVLSEFFKELGVDEETATEDACRIEHYISDKTFQAIKDHMNELNKK